MTASIELGQQEKSVEVLVKEHAGSINYVDITKSSHYNSKNDVTADMINRELAVSHGINVGYV